MDIKLGYYARVPLDATEQQIEDAKKKVLSAIMDKLLESDPFVVQAPIKGVADPLDINSNFITVGLALRTDMPWFECLLCE